MDAFERWAPIILGLITALGSLGVLMMKAGQWKSEREDAARHAKEEAEKLWDGMAECVQKETCNARQAEMKATAERANKVAHDARTALNAEMVKMEAKFIPRETVELQLKSINDHLQRIDDTNKTTAESTDKRLLSIETHLRAIRQNGNGVKV